MNKNLFMLGLGVASFGTTTVMCTQPSHAMKWVIDARKYENETTKTCKWDNGISTVDAKHWEYISAPEIPDYHLKAGTVIHYFRRGDVYFDYVKNAVIPVPKPDLVPDPIPTPKPDPIPIPTPEPNPVPEPAQQPTPILVPDPVPKPASTPIPAPLPNFQPQPLPNPEIPAPISTPTPTPESNSSDSSSLPEAKVDQSGGKFAPAQSPVPQLIPLPLVENNDNIIRQTENPLNNAEHPLAPNDILNSKPQTDNDLPDLSYFKTDTETAKPIKHKLPATGAKESGTLFKVIGSIIAVVVLMLTFHWRYQGVEK